MSHGVLQTLEFTTVNSVPYQTEFEIILYIIFHIIDHNKILLYEIV